MLGKNLVGVLPDDEFLFQVFFPIETNFDLFLPT